MRSPKFREENNISDLTESQHKYSRNDKFRGPNVQMSINIMANNQVKRFDTGIFNETSCMNSTSCDMESKFKKYKTPGSTMGDYT